MDISSIASGLAASGVASGVTGAVDVGVLKAVNNLDAATAAVLAASLGLGSNVDAYA